VLKGLVEDVHGAIKDDKDTPLPYLTFVEDGVRFIVYCPVQNDYELRLENTKPMADILLHLVDINLLKNGQVADDKETNEAVEEDLRAIKSIRYKRVLFAINKMDTVKWDTIAYNNAVEYIKQASKTLSLKIWHNTEPLSEISVVPLSTRRNRNITRKEKPSNTIEMMNKKQEESPRTEAKQASI
jgi:translation elongation factor EF-1alpha